MTNPNIITFDDDCVYLDGKLIANVKDDGSIKWKHYSYRRKFMDEVEDAIAQNADNGFSAPSDASEGEMWVDDWETSSERVEDQPVTPIEYFQMGEGNFYGESNPPVVDWRWENWNRKAYWTRYGAQEDMLKNIYARHDLIYDRNNTD